MLAFSFCFVGGGVVSLFGLVWCVSADFFSKGRRRRRRPPRVVDLGLWSQVRAWLRGRWLLEGEREVFKYAFCCWMGRRAARSSCGALCLPLHVTEPMDGQKFFQELAHLPLVSGVNNYHKQLMFD